MTKSLQRRKNTDIGKPTWWNTSFDPDNQNISQNDFKIHYELDFSDKPQAWEGIKDQYEKKEGKGNKNEGAVIYELDEEEHTLKVSM